jgi:HAD superfamily hydrolase (TIGR01549 family)
MPLSALLLDLDNTAYAYAPCHAAGLAAAQALAATRLGAWHDPEAFASDYHHARRQVKARVGERAAAHSRLLYFKQMLETALGRTDPAWALALDTAYWDHYLEAMARDPGCYEALLAFREAGLRLAWLSDMLTEQQLVKVLALGLADLAEFVITSEEAGAEKPDPAGVDLALARLGVPVAEAWLVGDSLQRDVGAARARGLTAVWFRRSQTDAPGPAPDHVVDDWFALRTLVEAARHE